MVTTDEVIDAAEERATLYADDDREQITTDVINSFYAGVYWLAKQLGVEIK